MQFITGKLLHKKDVSIKNGTEKLSIISILDIYDNFSKVIDIADFEKQAMKFNQGNELQIPIKTRVSVAESGKAFLNYSVAGQIKAVA